MCILKKLRPNLINLSAFVCNVSAGTAFLKNSGTEHNLKIFFVTRYFSSASKIPKNELKDFITADKQKLPGVIYDKKPHKLPLVAGKKYLWCLCGKSKTQPFCDGTHKIAQLKITQKPVAFQVSESKDYWLCNCKRTSNRPFCDGTHKTQAVQDGTSIVRQ